jgi:hypothetical protein
LIAPFGVATEQQKRHSLWGNRAIRLLAGGAAAQNSLSFPIDSAEVGLGGAPPGTTTTQE